jgi:hypothetical protein
MTRPCAFAEKWLYTYDRLHKPTFEGEFARSLAPDVDLNVKPGIITRSNP